MPQQPTIPRRPANQSSCPTRVPKFDDAGVGTISAANMRFTAPGAHLIWFDWIWQVWKRTGFDRKTFDDKKGFVLFAGLRETGAK